MASPAAPRRRSAVRATVRDDAIRLGRWLSVAFQRTLRIPDDGRTYPLPPGLGRFPLRRVTGSGRAVPAEWRRRGGFIIPMYQREALWLSFDGEPWHPCAVQIGVGGMNAVSGEPWQETLSAEPQNYLVCPDQPWLDGINSGAEVIRQFVAMPLGLGYTVEAQLTGVEEVGGIQIRVFEAKPGRFPERPPPAPPDTLEALRMAAPAGAMGLGAGGQMRQKIYPDSYGLDTWDPERVGSAFVQIVNAEQYAALTGELPPPTPIDASTYTEYGFPWFDLYDEARGDVEAARRLAAVKSVREKDAETGRVADQADEQSVEIDPAQVRKLRPPGV